MSSGVPVNITLAYNGSSAVTVSLLQGSNSWSNTYTGINLANTLGGSGTLVCFGFGGGQGGSYSIQQISNFSITSLAGNLGTLPSTSPAGRVRRGGGPQRRFAGKSSARFPMSAAPGGTLTNSAACPVDSSTVGNDGTNTTFSGVISDGSTVALTKTGSGVQTLTGSNSFTGALTVASGTLAVTHLQGDINGSGPITLGSAVVRPPCNSLASTTAAAAAPTC